MCFSEKVDPTPPPTLSLTGREAGRQLFLAPRGHPHSASRATLALSMLYGQFALGGRLMILFASSAQ